MSQQIEFDASPQFTVTLEPVPQLDVVYEDEPQLSLTALQRGPKGDPGQQGIPGPPGSTYEWTQSQPASTWGPIVHGLGYYPSVITIDTEFRQIIGRVSYPDVDSVLVEFASAFSGIAVCN